MSNAQAPSAQQFDCCVDINQSSMELFRNAETVRLRSHHEKYLVANDDEVSVYQHRNCNRANARWTVEIVDSCSGVIRLKSCYGKYLTASNMPYFLGMSGKKILQSLPRRLDCSVEWEPVREGVKIRLRTRYGLFLRANGRMPPWRHAITHDIPIRSSTQDWILWEVEVLEVREQPLPKPKPKQRQWQKHKSEPNFQYQPPPPPILEPAPIRKRDFSGSNELIDIRTSGFENDETSAPLPAKGRTVYYNVTKDDEGKAENAESQPSFTFNGTGLVELTQKLKEETGLDDFIVCSRNQINGKLYPLRLQLPPNNADMHVVLVPSSSKVARDLQEAR